MAAICSECGRPAVATPFVWKGKLRKKKFRGTRAIKGHDLCPACWERLNDQFQHGVFNVTAIAEKPTAATEEKPRYVARYSVENFMRLPVLSCELDGRHVMFSGPNGSGKTTAVRGIWVALKGCTQKSIPEPIHTGADRAKLHVELADGSGRITHTVDREFTDKGMKLLVRAADGSKVKNPQELLNSFLDAAAIAPFKWLGFRPQDQLDDVLRKFGAKPPVDEVAAITGESHPVWEGETAAHYLERLSADETGTYYVRRREAGRTMEQKEAARREFAEQVVGLDLEAPDEEKDMSALLAERSRLDLEREKRRVLQAKVTEFSGKVKETQDRLAGLKSERTISEKRIEELRRMLADEEAKAETIGKRIVKGLEIEAAWQKDQQAAQLAVDHVPDPSGAIAEIETKIKDADTDRQAIAERRQARETNARLATEAKQASESHAKQEIILTALRDLRRNLLNGRDIPIKGLEVGEGELRLNGISFAQASEGEQCQVACAIVAYANPCLQIVNLDGSERFDARHVREVIEMFTERGFQCIGGKVSDTHPVTGEKLTEVAFEIFDAVAA